MENPARTVALAAELRAVAERFIAAVERIGLELWTETRAGRWSPGKEAEHVAEAMVAHAWGVRRSLGQPAGPPPSVERKLATARGSAEEVIEALRAATESCVRLVESLTDEQLTLPALPTRTRTVGQTIERVMIGHVERHRVEIERATRRRARPEKLAATRRGQRQGGDAEAEASGFAQHDVRPGRKAGRQPEA